MFRDIESKVVGKEAAAVREVAKRHRREERSGQVELDFSSSQELDAVFRTQHERDLGQRSQRILTELRNEPLPWVDLWPSLLQDLHVRKIEVSAALLELEQEAAVRIERHRSGALSDNDVIRVATER